MLNMKNINHKQKSVLLIEDDETLAALFTDELKDIGFSVTHASDGNIALEFIKSKSFDAIISDLFMPNLDGISMVKRLNIKELGIPFLVVTGNVDQNLNEELYALGVTKIFNKPLTENTIHQLFAIING